MIPIPSHFPRAPRKSIKPRPSKFRGALLLVLACATVESPPAHAQARKVMLQFQSAAGAEAQPLPDTGELQAGGGRWSCQTQTSPVAGRQHCEDITVTVKLLEGEAHNLSMVRKQADGLAYGMKQLLLMREQKTPVPPAWETSARGLAEISTKAD